MTSSASPTHRDRTRARSLRARGLPLLWILLVAPQLLLPVGAIICFETCGEWEITGEHAAHSCDHAPESSHTECYDHGGHFGSCVPSQTQTAPSLSHNHEVVPGGSSCVDLRTGDETTAAKVIGAQVIAPPVDHSGVITLAPANRTSATRSIRERQPPLLFADCYLSPLQV